MKNILILCVNYNSYEELGNYLHSIDVAAKKVCDLFVIDVFVGDNTTENQQQILTDYTFINVRVFPYYKNLGYVGCATTMLNEITHVAVSQYDFVIISNVDLKLSPSFFTELLVVNTDNVGWIVPRIFTPKRETDENPQMLARPSRFKYYLSRYIYILPFIHSLYAYFGRFRYEDKKRLSLDVLPIDIYAGHGSIMIFTQAFIKTLADFVYPMFLYGEEIFFAEKIRANQLRTVFYPAIYVENVGNVSTSLLGDKTKCKYMYKANSYNYKTFFK